MKCKRADEFYMIGNKRYFIYEMTLSYRNGYLKPTPVKKMYLFSAITKSTGLEKYM